MPARKGVYVPDNLAKRMAKFPETNWSHVAQLAWEQECARLERRPPLANRLEELRAQYRESWAAEWEMANASAQEWASSSSDATYEVLLRAAEFAAADQDNHWEGVPSAFGWAFAIGNIVFGEDEWNRSDIEEFCAQWLGKEYPSASAVRGFILGMCEWFIEHRDEIEG